MNLTHQEPYQKHSVRRHKKPNDDAYLSWLRKQPSALSGKAPCEACHYRTAANSGTGIKPLWSAIPLIHDEHMEQHMVGTFNFMPREWWESMVLRHLQK